MEDAKCRIGNAGGRARVPEISYPASRISHPASRIPHLVSRVTYLASSIVILFAFWPVSAFAHTQEGEAAGFLTGFRHPISGLDHVLAMVAVGLWGAQLGAPAVWLLPVAFPLVMAIGGMLGLMGVPLPGIEYGIAASAILLGSAVMLRGPPPAGSRRRNGRLLCYLPRARARHRTSARPKRPALQHGLRHCDRMFARCRNQHQARCIDGYGDKNSCALPVLSLPWVVSSSCGERSRYETTLETITYSALRGGVVRLHDVPAGGEAHLNSTGMGPIYDGLMHFLMSPEDFVSVLALALLSGLRGATYGRRTLFVLPAAWLFGGFFGLAASASNGNAMVSAVWFLLLGGMLAADAKLSLRVTTALAVLLGLYHGYLNGAGLGLNFTAAAVLLGLTFSVFVLIALAASFVVPLQVSWARIAVRVAGSWIFASGLLLMGWALRSAHGRVF